MARRCGNLPQVDQMFLEKNQIYTTWPFSYSVEFKLPKLELFLQESANDDEMYMVPSKYILRLRNFRLGKKKKRHWSNLSLLA